jgi:aryl-alcohol dehydrogenase-like predicted oxidoreductase
MPYGIANRRGQVDRSECAAIIQRAYEAGIDTLDTAISYGDSESNLGKIGVANWRVVSKLPQLPDSTDVTTWVKRQMAESLTRLNVHSLYALLIHHPAALLGPDGATLYEAMVGAKNAGLVSKIGISAYGPEEIDEISSRFRIDIVQAPFSIVDRRLINSGCLGRMRQKGIELHARSVFLQGLLLMDRLHRPAGFERWDGLWAKWHDWLLQAHLTPLQACLGFVASQQGVHRLVVGVDSCAQLEQILAAMDMARGLTFPEELTCQDPQLINPSNWRAH